MKKIIKRSLILRECAKCKFSTLVRKDGVGKLCRSCKAKENEGKRFEDITGLIYGRLKVIKISHKNKQYFWECICDCGNKLITSGNRIRSGKTKSCGCIVASQNKLSNSILHRRWRAMINRCYNPNNINYNNYGGRGIKVCDAWINSFDRFKQDMGEMQEGMTIDRIDVNGNYEKSNCRWASIKEQNNNRRSNYMITAFGKTQTLQQWADEIGLKWSLIRQRIERDKWTYEKALTKK